MILTIVLMIVKIVLRGKMGYSVNPKVLSNGEADENDQCFYCGTIPTEGGFVALFMRDGHTTFAPIYIPMMKMLFIFVFFVQSTNKYGIFIFILTNIKHFISLGFSQYYGIKDDFSDIAL